MRGSQATVTSRRVAARASHSRRSLRISPYRSPIYPAIVSRIGKRAGSVAFHRFALPALRAIRRRQSRPLFTGDIFVSSNARIVYKPDRSMLPSEARRISFIPARTSGIPRVICILYSSRFSKCARAPSSAKR